MKGFFSRISIFAALLLFMGAGCFSLTSESSTETSGPGGIFASVDQGDSWSQVSLQPTENGVNTLSGISVYRLVEDPLDPDAMYWASRGDGLFFTYDNAKTWQKAKGAVGKGFIYSVQVHPDNKCLLYATNGPRVYRSEDCSRSWQEVYREDRPNARIAALLIAKDDERTLYMGKVNGDLLKSIDNGNNWAIVKRFSGKNIVEMFNDAVDPATIYITTRAQGLIRSIDGGEKWKTLGKPLNKYSKAKEYRSMLPHAKKEGVLYWVSTYGILKSEDKGDSWKPYKLVTSPGSVSVYGFAVDPQNDQDLFYATFNNGRTTFYRSRDEGATWSTEKLPSGQIPTVLRVHPENGTLFLGLTIPSQ